MINKIKKLDRSISNKIAAGEVIDRPASVIKELVENSVDARATTIVIEIKDAGKTFIRVSDNGIGINKEDLELAFERHATSKIKSDSDIYSIKSLGFRGEALASIASVSDIEIITKTLDNKAGIKGEFKNGRIVNKQDIGCPQGTTIIVKDLFYNIPARFKFLKSNSSETNHISSIVNKLALSHPEIAVTYIVDNKIIFATQGDKEIYNTIHTIYGKSISKNLIKIYDKENDMSINGYISNISISRGNRQLQIFFVNGRYVKSKVLSEAMELAYKTLLPSNKFPICYIYIDIPYDEVDVNIHPAKTDIRFHNEKLIENFITKTIKKYLLNRNLAPKVDIENNRTCSLTKGLTFKKSDNKQYENLNTINNKKLNTNKLELQKEILGKDEVASKNIMKDVQNIAQKQVPPEFNLYIDDYLKNNNNDLEVKEKGLIDNHEESILENINIIGQLFSTYILCEKNDSLIMIDQHAAHERILFDEFLNNYKMSEIISQILLEPIIVEMTYFDKKIVLENIDFFTKLGFQVEEFGHNTIILREVPMTFGIPSAKEFFIEILENIHGNIEKNYDRKLDRIIEMACKKAIKAHDKLENIEIKSLLSQLRELNNPFTCPHGRPIIIDISKQEIEKKFMRT